MCACEVCEAERMANEGVKRVNTISIQEAHDVLVAGLNLPDLKYKRIVVIVDVDQGVDVSADFHLNG